MSAMVKACRRQDRCELTHCECGVHLLEDTSPCPNGASCMAAIRAEEDARAEAQHTPLPWWADEDLVKAKDGMWREVATADGADSPAENEANARFIAQACNAHDALLLACEQARFWLKAEREHPGQALPDEILRVLNDAIVTAGGQP